MNFRTSSTVQEAIMSVTHIFNYIVLRVKLGPTNYEDLLTPLQYSCVN